MDFIEVKKPTTFDQQIEQLKEKGFIIDDEEQCRNFLNEANYYRLSAYLLPFRSKNEGYIQGINISRIQRIYEFDQHLRDLIFPIIERVEFYIRTQFSYYHAHKYGSLGYLDSTNFNKAHREKYFKDKINSCIKENKNSPIVKHHKQKYNGNFPIWVIIEFFSMGMLSYFYKDMPTQDRKHLAKAMFNLNYKTVESSLRCLTDLRNRCAHYSRLYFWIFSAVPRLEDNSFQKISRTLFCQVLMLKNLYPSPDQWRSNFLVKLSSLIEEYADSIDLKHIGFPENWYSILNK